MKTLAKMQGRRISKPPHSWNEGECPYQAGDYWLDEQDGTWHCVTPNGLLGCLRNHHVEEHMDDGTISVVQGPWGSNSILVGGGADGESWHGCIDRGIWKEF